MKGPVQKWATAMNTLLRGTNGQLITGKKWPLEMWKLKQH